MHRRRFIRRLQSRVSRLPQGVILAGLLLFLILLAYLDLITRRTLQLSLFYALVTGLVGWTLGGRAVVSVVVLSTGLTFLTDRLADSTVPIAFDIANHGFRALLWTLLGFALVNLRKRMDLLDDAYDLIRRDLEAGRKVQTVILSRELPEDERIRIGVRFRTALELGGDYFDVRVVEGRLQVLVADVSGKGAAAALVTALMGGIFSELSRRHRDPAKVLRILDQEITPSLVEGMFVTAFFLVLDLETGSCTYASAGHDPQILLRTSGAEELIPTGLPVGLLEGFDLNTVEVELKEADTLVLFTDGIVNLKLREGGRLGEEPLLKFLGDTEEREPQQLADSTFAFLEELGTFDDDALVLVLSWAGAGSALSD